MPVAACCSGCDFTAMDSIVAAAKNRVLTRVQVAVMESRMERTRTAELRVLCGEKIWEKGKRKRKQRGEERREKRRETKTRTKKNAEEKRGADAQETGGAERSALQR